MNDKKNIVTIVFIAVWIALLAVLMARLPISYMTDNFSETRIPPTVDIVISWCFCVVGIAAAVVGYFMSGRQLVILSALNPFMMLLSLICFLLYIAFFNRDILAFALYFANPFCAVLITPGFALLGIYAALSVVFPIAAALLLKRKGPGKSKSKSNCKVLNR